MLGGFADGYFDGGWGVGPASRRRLLALNDGLDAIAEKLSNYVFEVRENVGERGFEVAIEFEGWERDGGTIGVGGKLNYSVVAAGDDFVRRAFEEDFANEFGVWGNGGSVGVGKVPWGVKGLC